MFNTNLVKEMGLLGRGVVNIYCIRWRVVLGQTLNDVFKRIIIKLFQMRIEDLKIPLKKTGKKKVKESKIKTPN